MTTDTQGRILSCRAMARKIGDVMAIAMDSSPTPYVAINLTCRLHAGSPAWSLVVSLSVRKLVDVVGATMEEVLGKAEQILAAELEAYESAIHGDEKEVCNGGSEEATARG